MGMHGMHAAQMVVHCGWITQGTTGDGGPPLTSASAASEILLAPASGMLDSILPATAAHDVKPTTATVVSRCMARGACGGSSAIHIDMRGLPACRQRGAAVFDHVCDVAAR